MIIRTLSHDEQDGEYEQKQNRNAQAADHEQKLVYVVDFDFDWGCGKWSLRFFAIWASDAENDFVGIG